MLVFTAAFRMLGCRMGCGVRSRMGRAIVLLSRVRLVGRVRLIRGMIIGRRVVLRRRAIGCCRVIGRRRAIGRCRVITTGVISCRVIHHCRMITGVISSRTIICHVRITRRRRSARVYRIYVIVWSRMPSCCKMISPYPVHRHIGRTSVVGGSVRRFVLAGRMAVAELVLGRLYVVFVHDRLFLRIGLTGNPAGAVKACAVVDHRCVVDDRPVNIGIVYNRGIDVDDGRVIPEVSSGPSTADKAVAAVTAAIVTPTVETYVRSPIAAVPSIDATRIAPITRCPEKAWLRRCDPHTRYPIVTVIPISPITGRPEIPVGGTRGLRIYRQNGRPYVYRYANRKAKLGVSGRFDSQYQ